MQKTPVIGVITRRRNNAFSESLYFRGLHTEGRRMGARVIFFSEEDLHPKSRTVRGFTPDARGSWVQSTHPWPDIVIDRRRSRWTAAYLGLRRRRLFPYTSSKFDFKGTVTRMLAETEHVRGWIPKTYDYSSGNLIRLMEQFPLVYVKPGNGTGGGSVVRIKRKTGSWSVWGRGRRSELRKATLHSRRQVVEWINRWVQTERVRNGSFIVQQGLNLELIPGRVVDCRLLIQKNEKGVWALTGIATRIGGPRSPTTNLLYGDGQARRFDNFMKRHFGPERAAAIRSECIRMAFALVHVFETRYGPMMEFGMDVGIDVDGRVWLIEANPKPSRDVFLKTGERAIYLKAVRRPLAYALFLHRKRSQNRQGGVK